MGPRLGGAIVELPLPPPSGCAPVYVGAPRHWKLAVDASRQSAILALLEVLDCDCCDDALFSLCVWSVFMFFVRGLPEIL